jgi:hypothetical protein
MLPIAWFLILKIYKPVPVSKEQIQDFVAHIDVPEKMGRKEIYPLIITAATIDSAENADLVKSSDPVTYVSNFTAETAPRMLIEHGDSDTTVTYKNSQYLYEWHQGYLRNHEGDSEADAGHAAYGLRFLYRQQLNGCHR